MGFSNWAIGLAESWNKASFLITERAGVDIYCRNPMKNIDTPDRNKTGKWFKNSSDFYCNSWNFVFNI